MSAWRTDIFSSMWAFYHFTIKINFILHHYKFKLLPTWKNINEQNIGVNQPNEYGMLIHLIFTLAWPWYIVIILATCSTFSQNSSAWHCRNNLQEDNRQNILDKRSTLYKLVVSSCDNSHKFSVSVALTCQRNLRWRQDCTPMLISRESNNNFPPISFPQFYLCLARRNKAKSCMWRLEN